MTRILQTDFRLPDNYQLKGCLYRVALAIPEEEAGAPFTVEQLQSFYTRHGAQGLINANMGLDDEDSYVKILEDGFSAMRMPRAGGNQAGHYSRDEGFVYYGGGAPPNWHYTALNYEANTPDGHWLLGDAYASILFNPDPNVRIGRRRRIFFIKLWGV